MKIAMIGAGAMGESLLAGMLRGPISPDDIKVAEIRTERAAELTDRYQVTCSDARTAVADADVVLLVVKPHDIADVLVEISLALPPKALVVSLAAGITTAAIEAKLNSGQPVARVMPNTPSFVDQGMAGISAGAHCVTEHLAKAVTLMNSVGKSVVIPEELQNSLTAVSGSGPAYIFYVIESMVAGAVELGIDREMATELVVQTVFGAATLIQQSGDEAQILRERVSSPGGTTVAAINTLDTHGVRAAFSAAMSAARTRSEELGAQTN
jgi:pyrroline-5-carboxylate reductase